MRMKIIRVKKRLKDFSIVVEFKRGEKKGSFEYLLIGDNLGIKWCNYSDGENEDIYENIHSWVRNNVKIKVDIDVKGW